MCMGPDAKPPKDVFTLLDEDLDEVKRLKSENRKLKQEIEKLAFNNKEFSSLVATINKDMHSDIELESDPFPPDKKQRDQKLHARRVKTPIKKEKERLIYDFEQRRMISLNGVEYPELDEEKEEDEEIGEQEQQEQETKEPGWDELIREMNEIRNIIEKTKR
jgi:hypothetical protein